MSQADDDIRAAVNAYAAVYERPKITVSYFVDGTVQLFLRVPDRPSLPHAQGDGKTLDEAAVNLRKHLAKVLRVQKAKAEEDVAKFTARWTEFAAKCGTQATEVDPVKDGGEAPG
jgi:hypothetical protein